MEDKIEVNEYVRTKEGFIYKIENGEEFYEDSVDVGIGIIPDVDGIWIDRECLDYIDKRDIVKHSKQLIDLIEKDDYVNGRKVKHIAMFEGFPDYPKLIFVDETHLIPNDTCENEDIKTILTHEQFEANCYKVGGEEDEASND